MPHPDSSRDSGGALQPTDHEQGSDDRVGPTLPVFLIALVLLALVIILL